MKKLIILLSVLLSSLVYSQESQYTDIPYELYGVWRNLDNEFVKIYSDLDGQTLFQRVKGRKIIAKGVIKRVDDELHIIRTDNNDTYSLAFIIGKTNMVITRPRSDRAWLWDRIQ